MHSDLPKLRKLMVVWLTLSLCYSAYLFIEFKNSLSIGDPEEKLQRIEESTDLVRLKRTSRMYLDFMYAVHAASVWLWKVNVCYGFINVAFIIYLLATTSRGKWFYLRKGDEELPS